ncbi:M20 family metallopeptidase [Paenibacillus sp. N3.4]|uniref:M20 metallopeptidase family protein n=1 Tax=Paenibacillus sp. N3.4 TaxID=2603222 RepID=UPI0021C46EA5|nr:amidohydrolase [Paenibacillus sp. N3.4]
MNTALIFAYLDTIEDELVALRRDFHQHPEVLFDVTRTAAKVADLLEQWGLEVQRHVGQHFGMGVIGVLRGKKDAKLNENLQKTIVLRADMDALPIHEQTDASYKSLYDGFMHACGHDVHTTMLLGAAKALSRYREEWAGTVKFVFQAAEEGARVSPLDGRLLSGGADLVESGVLDDCGLCFGLHVWPELPIGTIGVHAQYAMAASTHFKVVFHGLTGHHSTPHLAADALLMASQFAIEMKVAMSSEIDPFEPAVLSFGTLKAGTVLNAIADHSEITGSYRTFDQEVVDKIRGTIEKRAGAIAESYGGTCSFSFRMGTALKNDHSAAQLVLQAGAEVLGREQSLLLEKPSLAGEDFALYVKRVPGAFAFIGVGNADRGIIIPFTIPSSM